MFKNYYDYVFDSDVEENYNIEFSLEDSVETELESYNSYPGSEVNYPIYKSDNEIEKESEAMIWYNNLLKEIDIFSNELNAFQKMYSKCIERYIIDPTQKFYVSKDSIQKSFFPDIEIFKKKKDNTMTRIKLKNSLVYQENNRYFTDFFLLYK